MRARLAAVATVAVLDLAGRDDPFVDDVAPRETAPSGHRSEGHRSEGHRSEGPRNPAPKPSPPTTRPTDPSSGPPSPRPWVPKGPATLTGCGTHASGHQCTFSGSNFKPGEKVRFRKDFDTVGGHILTADEDGWIGINLTSNTPSGTYTYVARGLESDRQAGTTVRITPGLWG